MTRDRSAEARWEDAAAQVTCCAGPMCCERKIAAALEKAHAEGREAEQSALDRLTQVKDRLVKDAEYLCEQRDGWMKRAEAAEGLLKNEKIYGERIARMLESERDALRAERDALLTERPELLRNKRIETLEAEVSRLQKLVREGKA